jgi:hypothetical protein
MYDCGYTMQMPKRALFGVPALHCFTMTDSRLLSLLAKSWVANFIGVRTVGKRDAQRQGRRYRYGLGATFDYRAELLPCQQKEPADAQAQGARRYRVDEREETLGNAGAGLRQRRVIPVQYGTSQLQKSGGAIRRAGCFPEMIKHVAQSAVIIDRLQVAPSLSLLAQ